MAATEDDIVDEFFKTVGTIQSIKNKLDNAYYDGIKEILEDAKKKVSAHTGNLLHDLAKTKPDQDTLQKMIAAVPLSLSHPSVSCVVFSQYWIPSSPRKGRNDTSSWWT